MILTYDAIDGSGNRKRASIEAPSEQDAVSSLRRQGLYVTQIRKKTNDVTTLQGAPTTSYRHTRLPLKTVALFTRQMAMLLRAGSGVVPAVAAIRRQIQKPEHARLLSGLIADLEEGVTFTEALRKYPNTFDPVYCAIVAAGEASAALPEMFENLAGIVGKRRAMRKKIIGAMVYPTLLIIMCFKILLVMLLFVLPRFAKMFEQLGVDAPASTKAMLAVGAAVRAHWMIGAAAVIALLTGAGVLLVSRGGRQWTSDIQIKIPLIGALRSKLIQGQVFRTMGMLLESRVGLLEAMDLARQSTQNRRFQEFFDTLEEKVTSGGQVGTAFDESGLIEPYICQAVRTGEDSGNLGGAMTYCADILDETNGEFINMVTKLVEPLILIVMGVIVGGVAISLFLPLFDLTAAMN